MAGKNQRPGLVKTYSPRYSTPPQSLKYYWSQSPFRTSGISIYHSHNGRQGNCTAYAWGRYWEISEHFGHSTKLSASGNAEDWYYGTNSGKSRGTTPQVGAVICFADGPYSGKGHVMVVENVTLTKNGYTIKCSESGYAAYLFQTRTLTYVKGKGFTSGISSAYKFQGYIYNPNVPRDVKVDAAISGEPSYSSSGAVTKVEAQNITAKLSYKTVKTTVTTTKLNTYNGDLDRTKSTSLLSYPSLVESPFIMVKLDNFTFGTYTNKSLPTTEKSKYRRLYPNYVKGLQVTKVNGTVNQYVITLVHQITEGDDPNFVDKVLSRVGYNTIKISYGDWASPSFIYKEEEALITKVSSNIDFGSSRVTYVIYATSSSLSLASNTFNWSKKNKKPSDVIISMLNNKKFGLTDLFYGMKNMSKKVLKSTLIASDDKVVEIPAKRNMDPLSYINYLVTCMTASTNTGSNSEVIKDSSYYMTIHDDVYGDENLNGPYFKITKVNSNGKTLQTKDTYEVDINYPSENLVTNFTVNNDNSWALLYNYSDKMSQQRYVYSIGDDGIVNLEESPNTVVSADKYKMVTEAQKTWWTNMTRFPITATMTIKGLVRPAMLMTQIRVNAMFYGQRHIASGLYIVTKQEDKIDGAGYRTTLSLQRIAGDNDYFTSTTKTVKSKVVDNITYSTSGISIGTNKKVTEKKEEIPLGHGLNKDNKKPMSKEKFMSSKAMNVRSLYPATEKGYEDYCNNVKKYGTVGALGSRVKKDKLKELGIKKVVTGGKNR